TPKGSGPKETHKVHQLDVPGTIVAGTPVFKALLAYRWRQTAALRGIHVCFKTLVAHGTKFCEKV
ncbi:MAG: hypothetical protein O7D30_09195, partial [Rickettsia endosymbiont of Ixodes persulcatus]|nr:hypothetical protein [Rickettsia endosymbiont of Ixodes persulcatus]